MNKLSYFVDTSKIKNLGFKKINVVKIPNNKIGIAINDRLKKAAY